MNQKKIGAFLKALRHEKNITQEELAEILGVTNRSISRWENGVNMPDFDLVIEIADYYNVSIEEILDGERREKKGENEKMIDSETEQTLLKVSDYENNDKRKISKRLCRLFLIAIAAFVLYAVIDILGLSSTGVYEDISTIALGLVFGTLLVGALYTSRYMKNVRSAKLRLLNKLKKSGNAQNTENKDG